MTQNDAPSPSPEIPSAAPRSRMPLIAGIAVVAVVIGAAAVYGISGTKRNETGGTATAASGGGNCNAAVEKAKAIQPLAKGEVAALTISGAPFRTPDLAFEDASGKTRKLSEWQGKTVLVNLWATWCVPCRKEMPALDQLQTKLGSDKFEVVAINIDTTNPDKPKAFLKDGNLTKLGYYTDAKAKVFQDLKAAGRALGMPTTVLVNSDGCELGFMAGPAEWASDDAVKLLTAAAK